ncbi:MAG: hypothetical protein ACLFV6_02800, partial [Spirulinaceae cyanobacterium]
MERFSDNLLVFCCLLFLVRVPLRLPATRGRTSCLLFVFPVLREVLFPRKMSETLALRMVFQNGSKLFLERLSASKIEFKFHRE